MKANITALLLSCTQLLLTLAVVYWTDVTQLSINRDYQRSFPTELPAGSNWYDTRYEILQHLAASFHIYFVPDCIQMQQFCVSCGSVSSAVSVHRAILSHSHVV